MRTGNLDVRVAASPSSHGGGVHAVARIGVIVPRYGQTAVSRNRVRRRLRELVRTRLLPAAPPCDIIIRALPQSYEAEYSALARDIDRLLGRVGRQDSAPGG